MRTIVLDEMQNHQTSCWLDHNLLINVINSKSVLGLPSDFKELPKLILQLKSTAGGKIPTIKIKDFSLI